MDGFLGVLGDFGVFGEVVFHDAGYVGYGEIAILRDVMDDDESEKLLVSEDKVGNTILNRYT